MLKYYCSINWIKGARKRLVPPNTNYAATIYIKDIDCVVSICIEIKDNVNEGYLSLLRPELINNVSICNRSFYVIEGNKQVALINIIQI